MSRNNQEEMRELASRCLSNFREKSHAELRGWVEAGHVEIFQAQGSGATRYQIEVSFLWDDEATGDIRVDAMIDEDPHRPLFGFLPVYVSSIGDGFIMRSDGSFIDE